MVCRCDSSVAHGKQKVDYGLFEEVRMAFAQASEQFVSDRFFDPIDSYFDLLYRVEVVNGCRFGFSGRCLSCCALRRVRPEWCKDLSRLGIVQSIWVSLQSIAPSLGAELSFPADWATARAL